VSESPFKLPGRRKSWWRRSVSSTIRTSQCTVTVTTQHEVPELLALHGEGDSEDVRVITIDLDKLDLKGPAGGEHGPDGVTAPGRRLGPGGRLARASVPHPSRHAAEGPTASES
jgi:hypothetical protein